MNADVADMRRLKLGGEEGEGKGTRHCSATSPATATTRQPHLNARSHGQNPD